MNICTHFNCSYNDVIIITLCFCMTVCTEVAISHSCIYSCIVLLHIVRSYFGGTGVCPLLYSL